MQEYPPEVQGYIDSIPDKRLSRFRQIMAFIADLYPDATLSMHYKMPTYIFGDGWIAVANKQQYISVYTCAAQHLVEFKSRYPNIKTGTGCINLKDKDDLDIPDLASVIHSAMNMRKP